MTNFLQTGLQTITQNFPSFISTPGKLILGEDCYTSLIYQVSPTSTCFRLAISKGLGIGIIVFGSILKIPQIITIVRNSSAWGISLSMYALEVVAYDISLAYAFRKRLPFSTYGENASLTVQNMIITLLIIWYGTNENGRKKVNSGLLTTSSNGRRKNGQHRSVPSLTHPSPENAEQDSIVFRRVLLAGIAMILFSIFLFILCPSGFLSILQAFSIPISLLSKFPQIAELYRNKRCGHLSSAVVFAQLAGTLARVFTTITETGDWLLGIGFGLASVLNAVIAVQYVYYWKHEKNHLGGGGTSSSLIKPKSGRISNVLWNPQSATNSKKQDDEKHQMNETNQPSSIVISVPSSETTISGDSDLSNSSMMFSSLHSSGRRPQEKGKRLD